MFHTPKFDEIAKAVFDAERDYVVTNGTKPVMHVYVEYYYHREVLREISYLGTRNATNHALDYYERCEVLGHKVWPVIQNMKNEKAPTFNICITGEQEA